MVKQDNLDREAARFLQSLRRLKQFAQHARIGEELLFLMDQFDTLVMHVNQEDQDVSITATKPSGERRVSVRRDLLTALSATNGREARKVCGSCKLEKVLSAFSVDQMRVDGHNRFCLQCERKRVKEYEQKKKKEAIAKAAAAVKPFKPSPPASQEPVTGQSDTESPGGTNLG